ncbi:uncharacterized protein NH340_JMT09111 [Sarcoptes scabiei]|nr:uncharacterized protein NH340_JMT09111 [Sarcoptes scabiei]
MISISLSPTQTIAKEFQKTPTLWSRYGDRFAIESILSNDNCFRCICAASSNCQINSRCRTIEPDKYLCGPFRLTEIYWKQINQSGKNSNPFAFELCANDLQCSIKIVKQYMRKYLQRCNLYELLLNSPRTVLDQCSLISLIHYQSIYGFETIRLNEEEDFDDEEDLIKWNDCLTIEKDIARNLNESIKFLRKKLPSTRSDNHYWRNYFDCIKLFPIKSKLQDYLF